MARVGGGGGVGAGAWELPHEWGEEKKKRGGGRGDKKRKTSTNSISNKNLDNFPNVWRLIKMILKG